VPTPESKRPALSSVYALTKYDQELAEWLGGQAATDRFEEAAAELDRRGLTT
jgi:hypothetical protein